MCIIIVIIIITGPRNDSFTTSSFFHQSGNSSDFSKSLNVLSSSKQKVTNIIVSKTSQLHIVIN